MKNNRYSQTKITIMITTTVFSFTGTANAFFLMGSTAIPWYALTSLVYFIPYAFIIAEYSQKFNLHAGGIYTWLKDVSSSKVALMLNFIWYSGYLVWLTSLSLKLWIPASYLFFGKDLTLIEHVFTGLSTSLLLALASIGVIIALTYLISKGFHNVAKLMLLSGKLILFIFFVALISQLILFLYSSPTLNISNPFSLQMSPNPDYQSTMANLSFFIFGITAYGGLDTIGSLVDKLAQNYNRFTHAIIFSAGLVTLLYLVTISFWSLTFDWQHIFGGKEVNLGNAVYILMGQLGKDLANSLGFSAGSSQIMSQFFIRLTGLTIFSVYCGLLATISYAPLKAFYTSHTKKQLTSAWPLWFQAIWISFMVILISLDSEGVSLLYNRLTLMTNLSRALPYYFLALYYPMFKRKYTELQLIRQSWQVWYLSISVRISVGLAIVFTLAKPLLEQDWGTFFYMIFGPSLICLIALIYFHVKYPSQP